MAHVSMASGRLDTAARSLELLLADNMEDAMKLADDLYDLNQSRKAMTEQGKGTGDSEH